MNEPAPDVTTSLPPASANGAASPPEPESPPEPAPPASAPQSSRRGQGRSRIGQVNTALIAGAVLLVLVLIFIIENAGDVTISYFGAHGRLSLAVALLFAAIGGALIMAAVGLARIGQLRLSVRRNRRSPGA